MREEDETTQHRNWWTPVWKGLVMDEGAAHFQKMGNALWLFLYLLLNANRTTGTLMRKVRTISADTGIQRRRIFEWLSILREKEYISTKNSGRCLLITINKWKPLGEVPKPAHQKCGIPHLRSAENRTSQTSLQVPKSAWIKDKLAARGAPKKNMIKKNILKRRYDSIDYKNPDLSAFKTREELLALDLARGLGDFDNYLLYLSYAQRYPESLLRETLGRVREIPADKIKTSRGALFNFLIQNRGNKNQNGAGH
jgi:hypothetical protein